MVTFIQQEPEPIFKMLVQMLIEMVKTHEAIAIAAAAVSAVSTLAIVFYLLGQSHQKDKDEEKFSSYRAENQALRDKLITAKPLVIQYLELPPERNYSQEASPDRAMHKAMKTVGSALRFARRHEAKHHHQH